MARLDAFDTPARLGELSKVARQAWNDDVVAPMVAGFAARFPQFYDPVAEDAPEDLNPAQIAWPAFPAVVQRQLGPGPNRWQVADSNRDRQDEYCEWGVERDKQGKIIRITFTTEVPEYWEHLARHDEALLVELYRQHVDPRVTRDELFDAEGNYVPANAWNDSTTGRPAHLVQADNTLGAAVKLLADATVLRQRADGTPVTDRQELVVCGGLGNPFRNSDPQIAEVVNDAVTLGSEVTLLDPCGIYLDALISAGMKTPDDTDAATFWTIERGTPEHTVRASFAVPEETGYTVGDITIGGRPIERGAQVADKVRVRIQAVVKPGNHVPTRRPCGA